MLKHLSKLLVVLPFLPFIMTVFLNTISLVFAGEMALSYPRIPSRLLLLIAKLKLLKAVLQ